MLQSNMADILLGIIGVYIALSLISTTINEWVMRQVYSRGENLQRAIVGMLTDEDQKSPLVDAFFKHPFFTKLHEKEGRLPSYLNDHDFSQILVDVLANFKDGKTHDLAQVKEGLLKLPQNPTQALLLSFLANSKDLKEFDHKLQNWFKSTMERASGWYKRKAHLSLFQIGFLLAAILNVDSFSLYQHLQKDTQSLAALTEVATQLSLDSNNTVSDWSPVLQIIDKPTFFGMGWEAPQELYFTSKVFWALSQVPQHLLGWIITAIAISFGAPFWFDLLSKFTRIKPQVKPTSNPPNQGEKA